jgi:hypothetical protein
MVESYHEKVPLEFDNSELEIKKRLYISATTRARRWHGKCCTPVEI